MNHFILFFAVFCGGYLGFLAILLIFQKLFFPFFTKEQLEKRTGKKELIAE